MATKQVERSERIGTNPLLVAAATVLIVAGLFCLSPSAQSSLTLENNGVAESFSRSLRSKGIHDSGNSLVSSLSLLTADSISNPSSTKHNDGAQQKTGRRRLAMEEDDFVEKSRRDHFPLFKSGDTFSVLGPTVFPKPTYIYETDENNVKIEDETIVTHLQPTSGKHRPGQDSVFVFAAEYSFDTYVLFFMTLFETGFKGDVVVGISKMDWENKQIREFLEHWKNEAEEDEMTVVVYVVPYHCYDLEGRVQPSHKGGMRVCQCHNMFGQKNKQTGAVTPLLDKRHGRTAQTIRYELYWIWSEHYEPSSWILLIDARDTIFQETPFARVPRSSAADVEKEGGTLLFFGENADATSLGKSKYNRRWLTLAYGEDIANSFKDKPTICSGSTMGEQSAIDAYLRAEVAESDESKTVIFGADQGFHNYLYYSDKLVNAKAISRIVVQDQGLGLVNNMGALRDKKLSEWGNGKIVEKTDTKITIYNWDGTISPVVHQYDRHKELSNWWHKKKLGDFNKQWREMKMK